MQKQNTFKKYAGLLVLGYVGGTIYLLMYVRYCFYDQMINTLQCTNTQLAFISTVCSVALVPLQFIGSFLADKFDAKHVIVLSVGGITVLTFIYACFVSNYNMAIFIWFMQAVVTAAYWPCLVKYINSIGGEEESGNSFGTYYLFNGLSGALGNLIPVYFSQHYGFRAVIVCYGIMTLIATALVMVSLDDEKKLAQRGVYLKGDDPIELRHIPMVLKWPGTYIIFFAYVATYTIYSNVSYFNPYLINVIGIDPDASSAYSVIRSYGAMIVAPLGGVMADKVFKSTSTWYIVAFAIAAVMFAVPLTFSAKSNVTLVCIYSILPSLVIFALYAVTFSILRELHIPAMVSGTAIGIGSLSFVFVDGVWPLLFGSWLDKFGNKGYTMIFIFLICDCICGILIAIWAKKHDKKCQEGKLVFKTE